MPGRGCRGQGGNSLALNSQNTQEKMTSFPEPLGWLQLSTTPGGALYHRQILLCSCSLLVCLFLIPHLFQGRKRAPAASPLRAAPALPGGDAGGAACPSACCGHTSCVASGRRQPRFPGIPLPKSFDQGRARSRAHVSCNPSFPAHPLLRGKGKFIRAAVRGTPHRQAGLGTEQYFCSCAAARIRSAARAPQDLFQKSFVLGLP